MIREPLFGMHGWYPLDKAKAEVMLDSFLQSEQEPKKAFGLIAPHAGWVFSGSTAGKAYAEVVVPERVIVLCPSHRSQGGKAGVWPDGAWKTPLGEMAVDSAFAARLIEQSPLAQADYASHQEEHAIEIQLPFLQRRNPKAKLVPIRLGHLNQEEIESLAKTLAKLIGESETESLLVASSDMSHEASRALVAENDEHAIGRILAMDWTGLLDVVEEHRITMCGYLPAAVTMAACVRLGAKRAKKLAYRTSYDVSGRDDYVVGYLAAMFF